jgi:[pyruvate, water dikinase]-phosphate phosphotransferase / [pyruvate, water dikinase] kinase
MGFAYNEGAGDGTGVESVCETHTGLSAFPHGSEPMSIKRAVFFISDRTAITAETFGHSLLIQFDDVDFQKVTLPFIDTMWKARDALEHINDAKEQTGQRPIIFSTIVNSEIRKLILSSEAAVVDLFDTFIGPLEEELRVQPTLGGSSHHPSAGDEFDIRINAVNYALTNDDGITTKNYDIADVILVGVSRTGKTPTCLYLGLQYGIYAANYPLTEEDLLIEYRKIPGVLQPYRNKLHGLTINPDRLQKIRSARRPTGRYSSLEQCQKEISLAEFLYVSKNIPYLNITTMSIEEIAAMVMHKSKLQRRIF